MPDAANSHFLALPAELCNRIYELAFKDNKVDGRITRRTPGLFLACKQTFLEARGMYYTETTFAFSNAALKLPEDFALRFTKLPCECRRHVEKIVLELPQAALGMKQYHDDDLRLITRHAQENLLRVQKKLSDHGLQNLAAKAKATILVPIAGQSPFIGLESRSMGDLLRTQASLRHPLTEYIHVSNFFERTHMVPWRCWSNYQIPCGDGTCNCGCPIKSESIEHGTVIQKARSRSRAETKGPRSLADEQLRKRET